MASTTAFVTTFSGFSLQRTTLSGTRLTHAVSRNPPSSNVVTMRTSKALPFTEAPPKLDGSMVGDFGFDPFHLSDYINLKYAREGELKNGRVAMLASLGIVVQELIQLPGRYFSEKNPLKAIYSVPIEGWIQIILFISIIELATFKRTYTSEPGDYGFDPLKLSRSRDFDTLRLSELKHSRLAMISVIGFIVQTLVTGKPILKQLVDLKLPF